MSTNNEQTMAALNTLIDLALQTARVQQSQVQQSAQIIANALGLGNEGEKAPEGEEEGQVEHGDSDSSAEEGPKIVLAEG
jgi:hypothetical protein